MAPQPVTAILDLESAHRSDGVQFQLRSAKDVFTREHITTKIDYLVWVSLGRPGAVTIELSPTVEAEDA